LIRVGTAGWSLYRGGDAVRGEGTQLERYSRILPCVEINSSFYRPHAAQTYAKWASMTPRSFRFAIKVPQSITHDQRLRRARRPLQAFLAQVEGLGTRLGPLLVQLPPSLEFERRAARTFFATLRELHDGAVVCEPRHADWFGDRAQGLLEAHQIGRVAADPAPWSGSATPGGWLGIVYFRLHGSPRRYWSVYERDVLVAQARALRATGPHTEAWCIFDNTAGGGALPNAVDVRDLVKGLRRRARAGAHAGESGFPRSTRD
jgi:uncharacterized protein YecE (DUF72 family)